MIAQLDNNSVSGVTILVHKRHSKSIIRLKLMNDCCMSIDVKLYGRIIRVISMYVPHTRYSWDDFWSMMHMFVSCIMEAQDRLYQIIIGEISISILMLDHEEIL